MLIMKWRLIESNIRNLQMNHYESLNGALGVLCLHWADVECFLQLL